MKKKNFKYTLSIIIPCFNEITTIKEIISKVKNSPIENKEIIIINHRTNIAPICMETS